VRNAVWYLTNQHQVIEEASRKSSKVIPVPELFDKFQGYDDYKKKA
jgi:hypothetical protein